MSAENTTEPSPVKRKKKEYEQETYPCICTEPKKHYFEVPCQRKFNEGGVLCEYCDPDGMNHQKWFGI